MTFIITWGASLLCIIGFFFLCFVAWMLVELLYAFLAERVFKEKFSEGDIAGFIGLTILLIIISGIISASVVYG